MRTAPYFKEIIKNGLKRQTYILKIKFTNLKLIIRWKFQIFSTVSYKTR